MDSTTSSLSSLKRRLSKWRPCKFCMIQFLSTSSSVSPTEYTWHRHGKSAPSFSLFLLFFFEKISAWLSHSWEVEMYIAKPFLQIHVQKLRLCLVSHWPLQQRSKHFNLFFKAAAWAHTWLNYQKKKC